VEGVWGNREVPSAPKIALAETAPRHRGDERLAIGHLVVPRQRDAAHQVRVRCEQTVLCPKSDRKPVHAALAPDAGYLQDVRALSHAY
jgi:hypothetical protein